MLGRNNSLGWRLAIAALSLIARCGAAIAQGASPPPPAVSVTPVVSRQVTETGDFIGRVTAIDKVDIAARVSNTCCEARNSPQVVADMSQHLGSPYANNFAVRTPD